MWPGENIMLGGRQVLLLAAFVAGVSATVFQAGKEFIYDYESQVGVGIPIAGDQKSIIKIKAVVKLQFRRDNVVLFALSDVAIHKAAGALPSGAALMIIADDKLEEVVGMEADAMRTSLTKPGRCRYEGGIFTRVELAPDQPVWARNFIKGILNMLQLNLRQKGAIAPVSPDMLQALRLRAGKMSKMFWAMEPGFAGVCEAVYGVMKTTAAVKEVEEVMMGYGYTPAAPIAAVQSASRMRVTKMWNLNNCEVAPLHGIGLFASMPLTAGIGSMAGPAGKDMVVISTKADYDVSGKRSNFGIVKGVQVTTVSSAPFALKEGRMEANILQVLQVVEVGPIVTRIVVGKALEICPLCLQMAVQMPYEPIFDIVVEKVVEQVEAILDEIIKAVATGIKTDTATLIIKLAEALKVAPAEALQVLAQKYMLIKEPAGDDAKKQQILLDALPGIPNPAVLPIMLECINEEIVSTPTAMLIINMLAISLPAVPEYIEPAIEAVKGSKRIASNDLIRRTVILAIGTLTRRWWQTNRKTMDAAQLVEQPYAKLISRTFRTLLREATVPTEEKVILKGMGNSGLVVFLADLKNVMMNLNLPKDVREQAMYGTIHMAAIAPEMVTQILMPIFLRPAEHQEVRVAAFVIIMETRPDYNVILMLAEALRTEKNVQVGSFVYSYLMAMSNSVLPPFAVTAKHCSHILTLIRPVIPNMFTSKVVQFGMFIENMQAAAAVNLYMVSDGGVLPKTVVAKLHAYQFGQLVNILEVGVEIGGMQAALGKLFQPDGILYGIMAGPDALMKVAAPILEPILGSFSTQLKEILDKLNIVDRGDGDLNAYIYAKIFDNEVGIFFMEADKDYIAEGKWLVAELEKFIMKGAQMNILRSFVLADSAVAMPTPVGMTLKLKVNAVAALHVDGSLAVEGLGSLIQLISKNPVSKPITMNFNLKQSAVIEVTGHCVIDGGPLRAGVAVKGLLHEQMPIVGNAELDLTEWKLTTKLDIPNEALDLLTVQIHPIVYCDVFSATYAPIVFESIVVPIINPTIVHEIPINMPMTIPGAGFKIIVTGQIVAGLPVYVPTFPMSGAVNLVVKLDPMSAPVKTLMYEMMYVGSLSSQGEDVVNSAEMSMACGQFLPVSSEWHVETEAHSLVVGLSTVGGKGQAGTLACAQLKWMHSEDALFQQLNWQWLLQPGSGLVDAPTTIFADTVLFVPRLIAALLPMSAEAVSDVICKVELVMKQAGVDEAKAVINIKSGDMATVVRPSGALSLIANVISGTAPYDAADAAITMPLYAVTAVINVEKMPEMTSTAVCIVDQLVMLVLRAALRVLPFPLTTTSPQAGIARQTVIVAKVIPGWQEMPVMVELPSGVAYFVNIPIAFPMLYNRALSGDMPIAMLGPMDRAVAEDYQSDDAHAWWTGQCVIVGQKLTTFDGVTVRLPDQAVGCEALVAMDCNSEGNFTVKVASGDGFSWHFKKVIVQFPTNKFVIVKASQMMTIYNNGEDLGLLSPGQPIVIKEGNAWFVISTSDGMISVFAKHIGVTVKTDCYTIIVKANALMRQRVCGLCGDYNGETMGDLVGPSGEAITDAAVFAGHYLLPSDTCPTGAIQRSLSTGAQCTMMKNIVKYKMIGHVQKICLSTTGYTHCATGCMGSAMVQTNIAMHCLNVGDMSTNQIMTELKSGNVIDLQAKSVEWEEMMDIPTACSDA